MRIGYLRVEEIMEGGDVRERDLGVVPGPRKVGSFSLVF